MRPYKMRPYNHKISAKANKSLQKRAVVVALQKRLIAISAILIISLIILSGTTFVAFAKASKQTKPVKEYISIQVQTGDSLWSIAEEYTKDYDINIEDYINEVKSVNSLKSESIHSGQFIIVPEYHTSAL